MNKSENEITEKVLNDYISQHIDTKGNILNKKLHKFFSIEKINLLFSNNFLFISSVNFLGIVVTIYFLLILFK
jgi:hypothetical protein